MMIFLIIEILFFVVVAVVISYPILKVLLSARYQPRGSSRAFVSPLTFQRYNKVLVFLFLLSFCAGIIFILGDPIQETILASRSATWPLTKGIITESKVEGRWGYRHSQRSRQYLYGPHVAYRFSVNNVEYDGSKIYFGFDSTVLSTTPDLAKGFVAKYPRGLEVWVAYDPHNPAVSVLEPGHHESTTTIVIVLVVGSFVLILVGSAAFSILRC